MDQLQVRPIKQWDLTGINCYGCSVRGIVGTLNDEPVMFAGVMYSDPMQAFSLLTDEGRKYPKMIIRMIREFKELVEDIDAPIYAVADENESNSKKVLKMAGFRKLYENTFMAGGK